MSTMPSKLKKAIAAVKDQTSISLAKVSSNASSNLEVAVLKATTHEAVPIDDKYVCEILQLVSSNKVHAATCARVIGKRIGRTRNWVVALKSLMLVLRIFQDGDPYFPREVLHAMKRGAKILNLSSFRDHSNSSPWDFTSFVRTFALYLDERLECFLTGKLQRRYTYEGSTSTYTRSKSRGARNPNEPVRDMKPAMLLDKMSYWQRLLERAIATRPTGAAKTNHLILISLHAIVQESFDLYKDISDGLALVLDSFFHLQYQNCVTAFQTCVKAVKQFEELSAFYALCKSIGVGRSSEYPCVQVISEELIETLQEFLKDQSSFPCITKPTNRLAILPPPSPNDGTTSSQHSYGGQSDFSPTTDGFSDMTSEFGSQSTSLEDLITATETWTGPAISIDLETYSASERDDGFELQDTGSSRSLPVSASIADLISLDDWAGDEKEEQDHQQDQHEQKQKPSLDSLESKNWELMLAETMSSSPSSSSRQPFSDNNTSTFNAFQEQPPAMDGNPSTAPTTPTNGWDLVLFESAPAETNTYNAFQKQPPSVDKNPSTTPTTPTNGWDLVLFETAPAETNTFNAFQKQPPAMDENPSTAPTTPTNGWDLVLFDAAAAETNTFNSFQEKPPATHENPSTTPTNGWNLVLFDAATPPPPQPLPTLQLPPPPPDNHYNPFLLEPMVLPKSPYEQSAMFSPTFHSTPTFSAQNPNQTPFPLQIENDPFAPAAEISGERMLSSGADQQNLLNEQNLWLQNQNKIIAKHLA
ncbi:Clathrin coat assembly protein [Sesamum alatum]|uniref:Clathrin coat assembly protein n=1 Tax=Sesamum alatum TaxID=300844 RepID=A0AAE2CWR0_9LAMI|nr:Clathrin coat assembly protein [Sesamum alatum]